LKEKMVDMDRRRSMTMDDALRVSLLRLADSVASPPPRPQDNTATTQTMALKKRKHAPELSHADSGQHHQDSAAIERILSTFSVLKASEQDARFCWLVLTAKTGCAD
jgi:hypothetical protein